MYYSPNCKLWVEKEGKKVFGDGPCDLLHRIRRTGSLRTAAAEINMSYSQAWRLLDSLDRKLGFPLLVKRVGGPEGGGSELTAEGEDLVRRYTSYRDEAKKVLQGLFVKHFGPPAKGK